jgi:uncharacterized membrane protein
MSYAAFRTFKLIIVIIIAVSVSTSVAAGIPWLPVPAAALGAALMLLARRRVKEIVVDERTWHIAERAGRLAFQVGAILMALSAATFLALSRAGNEAFEEAGFVLAYAVCGLMAIYYAGYLYYSKKLGGGE